MAANGYTLYGCNTFGASEASSDTIFDVRTLCRPILLEAKRKFCGLASLLAMDDYPSAISAHSKMAVVVCPTVIPFVLYLLGQTK